jgi:hypothetical protein
MDFLKTPLIFLFLVIFPLIGSKSQEPDKRIFFISDTQLPLLAEKMVLKTYHNAEARDSLFTDILHNHPKNLLMLGDLTSMGSNEKAWNPLDTFYNSLRNSGTNLFAIPGNHEYMMIPSVAIKMFVKHFPETWLHGYCIKIDSLGIVMLNSNFDKMNDNELSKQLLWYKNMMDSLQNDPGILSVIVCTHHAPYSNSKIVGSSKPVSDLIVPLFEKCSKARLFISGHSHNLEFFKDRLNKYFLVIGGGGGIQQTIDTTIRRDLIQQTEKPLYFYLIAQRKNNFLKLSARGFKKDFKMFQLNFGEIRIKSE